MAVTSIVTNNGAMIALQSLEMTQQQLAVTQKQISTGYRVADSSDDGAAFAIAQSVRSSVGALTSANQQLGNVHGLLTTTQHALTSVSTTMNSMRDVLVKLADSNTQSNDRTNYQAQYKSLLAQMKTEITDASYNGKTLLDNFTATADANGTYGTVQVARNESGATYSVGQVDGSSFYNTLAGITAAASAADYRVYITQGGKFITQQNNVGQSLNTIGNSINYVQNQVSYNNDKIDSLNSGLGALVDADMAKESAQLTALQIRQQLGTQALSLANQAPQSLLSLFK